MKIVIDIDEEEYNALYKFFHGYKYPHTLGLDGRMFYAVANGVILPKGHGDLIDRKELAIAPIDSTDLPTDRCLMVYLAEDVDRAPTIIEADKEEENE